MAIYKGSNLISGNMDLTTETFPLLTSHWSDHILDHISWLRADNFSWHNGQIYTLAYNELLSEYNNENSTTETEGSITFKRTPKGYKIADSTQETAILNKYNSDGIAWYYILDTANTQFKFPRTKFGFEGLRNNVGNDISESLPNIIGQFGNSWSICEYDSTNTSGAFSAINENTWTPDRTNNQVGPDYTTVSFDASRSSSVYQNNAPVQERATQMYLYFYVGQFTQTAIQQTAGLNSELFNNKVDLNCANLSTSGKEIISNLGMPSDNYVNLTLGSSGTRYAAPGDGYLVISKRGSSAGQYLAVYSGTSEQISNVVVCSANGAEVSMVLPMKKDTSFLVGYTVSGATERFRFVYTEGDNS